VTRAGLAKSIDSAIKEANRVIQQAAAAHADDVKSH
jgi:hypothetical protein